MEFKDYYKILGVEPDADEDAIKRAYRKLARKYHPDVSKETDAESRFKDISEAYEVLKDPEKRKAYDQVRAQPHGGPGGDWRPPPGWEGGFGFGDGGGGFGGADVGPDIGDFSEFFETLFGGGRRAGAGFGGRGFAARGADQRARITIDLETAYKGGLRTLTLQEPGNTRNLKVRIPAGVTDGQHIRLRGQGGAGSGGGPAGDILLEVSIAPHPLFSVEGRDVLLTLPITPWEAALGAKVPVPTLDGRVDLTIPAGSQSGKKLRLKGRGLPGKIKGDQYVILRIVTPPADSEAAKKAYRELAEATAYDPRAHMAGGR